MSRWPAAEWLIPRSRTSRAQFLDVGSGLPTADNVHQIAHRIDPQTRVVYVDNDPDVIAHAQALLAAERGAIAVEGDLRHPPDVRTNRDVSAQLDWDQPIGMLLRRGRSRDRRRSGRAPGGARARAVPDVGRDKQPSRRAGPGRSGIGPGVAVAPGRGHAWRARSSRAAAGPRRCRQEALTAA